MKEIKKAVVILGQALGVIMGTNTSTSSWDVPRNNPDKYIDTSF